MSRLGDAPSEKLGVEKDGCGSSYGSAEASLNFVMLRCGNWRQGWVELSAAGIILVVAGGLSGAGAAIHGSVYGGVGVIVVAALGPNKR